jgi:EAL domain-containing protein (putative c-di-GMP-specific phosphodiesterase class I)
VILAADEPTGQAFVRAAVDLATHLGATVIAEGIESTERAERMLRLGCHRGQGHLWSRALPPMLAERLLVGGSWPTGQASVMGVSASSWRH